MGSTGNQQRRGRLQKPYQSRNGPVAGLRRRSDGRWVIVATGQTFVEPDEDLAIARFRAWEAAQPRDMVHLPVPTSGGGIETALTEASRGKAILNFTPGVPVVVERAIPAEHIWPWLRRMLIEQPDVVARNVGIPQVARLAELPLPRDPIQLEELIATYQANSDASADVRRKVTAAWHELVSLTGARTLADLTVAKFNAYGDTIKKRKWCADYVGNQFTRIKRVIRFGLQRGMDAGQIRSALDRAAVLVAPKAKRKYNPRPIKAEDFAKLLKESEKDVFWTAALLLSMNACLYGSELLDIEWDELDLKAGTYLSDRKKTGIIRAAALWPCTVAAIKRLPRTPGKVFKSARGSAYHPNSFRKLFAKLRKAAGVHAKIEYNQIRDGSYSAAVASGVSEQHCRVLAGHRAPGLSDHYVARNPGMVGQACEAVARAYRIPPAVELQAQLGSA